MNGPNFSASLLRWETVAALAAAIFSLVLLPLPAAPFAAGLALLAVLIAVVDLEYFIIPDLANAAIFVLALVLLWIETPPFSRWEEIADALLRMLVAGGTLFAVRFVYQRLTGIEGLGLGDVKLAAAGAPFLAWTTLPYTLLMATLAAGIVMAALAVRQREKPKGRQALPFGAFLAPALWVSFVLERLGFLLA